jgi:DeoR/GlpR family transcriptional regulator of sugar metabolism
MINRIIEQVKEKGRIMTEDVVAMFNLHRTTVEKYIWIVVQPREHIRHGR